MTGLERGGDVLVAVAEDFLGWGGSWLRRSGFDTEALAVSMRLRRERGSRGAAEVAENGPLGRTSGQSPLGEWLPRLECSGAPLSLRSPRLRVRQRPHGYGLVSWAGSAPGNPVLGVGGGMG
jgi:hypothetical protein